MVYIHCRKNFPYQCVGVRHSSTASASSSFQYWQLVPSLLKERQKKRLCIIHCRVLHSLGLKNALPSLRLRFIIFLATMYRSASFPVWIPRLNIPVKVNFGFLRVIRTGFLLLLFLIVTWADSSPS